MKLRSLISHTLGAISLVLAPICVSGAPPIRILPLGDSITYGSSVPGGYRLPLHQLLTNAGFNVDYLGTQTGNSAAGLPDPDHEGHSGWRIDQIDSIILSVFGQIADPDVILLLLGTNDYGQNYDTAHATNRLEALIARMATNRPFAKIIVANLTRRNEPYNTQIQQTFNPFVPGIVARQAALGRQVYFTDLYSAIPLSDFPDQLHPGAVGYAKMATNWFTAITNQFGPNGSTNAPVIAHVSGQLGLTNVVVTFSKPVADSATTLTNFSLSGGLMALGAALDPASQRDITLTTTTQSPSTWYTLTVNGVCDRTPSQTSIAPDSTVIFLSSGSGLPGATNNVAEAVSHVPVYSLNIPNTPNYSAGIAYDLDLRTNVNQFTRIAYYLELQTNGGPLNFIWVAMNAFTTNVNLIGVPTASSGAFFQQPVTNLTVFCSVPSIVCGTNLSGGNLEFWSSNYTQTNSAAVPNASNATYDWGDRPTATGNYGSMQLHNHDAGQVLFAFNRWGGTGGVADLGIGNSSTANPDWTFAQNATSYVVKALQVFVLPPGKPEMRGVTIAGNTVQVAFAGPSGYQHQLLRSTDLTNWTVLDTITMPPTGVYTSEDATPPSEQAYYRAVLLE